MKRPSCHSSTGAKSKLLLTSKLVLVLTSAISNSLFNFLIAGTRTRWIVWPLPMPRIHQQPWAKLRRLRTLPNVQKAMAFEERVKSMPVAWAHGRKRRSSFSGLNCAFVKNHRHRSPDPQTSYTSDYWWKPQLLLRLNRWVFRTFPLWIFTIFLAICSAV